MDDIKISGASGLVNGTNNLVGIFNNKLVLITFSPQGMADIKYMLPGINLTWLEVRLRELLTQGTIEE